MKSKAIAHFPLAGPMRALQSELARVSRHHVVGTEGLADTVHRFAHEGEPYHRTPGFRLLQKIPYPLSPPGQRLTFQVFQKQKTGLDASCAS